MSFFHLYIYVVLFFPSHLEILNDLENDSKIEDQPSFWRDQTQQAM